MTNTNTTGPCAKATVTCTLVHPDGRRWVGQNVCRNAQPVCPRSPGEDYTKCKAVCDQIGHAEVHALLLAGDDARSSAAYIEGHTYACMDCQHALFGAGVASISIGSPPASNISTTAAQPLDLDKLEALARAATPGPWAHSRFGALVAGPMQKFVNGEGQEQIAMTTGTSWMRKDESLANADFIAAANPANILALIAKARASQPESAAPSVPNGYALVPKAANADEIVSRLYRRFKDWAARGFGPSDVTWCEVKADVLAMIAETSPSATGTTGASVKPWEERIAERHPHSEAQYWPDDLKAKYMAYEIADLRAQLAAKGQGEPWTITRLHDLGTVKGAQGELIAQTYYRDAKAFMDAHNATISAPASAQPADAPHFANDGREPDWAGYAAAEAGLPDIKELVNRFLGWPLPDSLSARIAPNVTKPIGTHLMDADEAKAMFEHCLQVAAVAPSDAKGKADAANAGGRTIDTPEFRNLLGDMLDAYRKEMQGGPAQAYEKARPKLIAYIDAKLTQYPATSAADEKDAALADVLNTTLWLYRRLPQAYGNPPFVDKAILTMAERLGLDDVPAAIKERAAMAAAPSSEKGNAK